MLNGSFSPSDLFAVKIHPRVSNPGGIPALDPTFSETWIGFLKETPQMSRGRLQIQVALRDTSALEGRI